MNLAYRRPLSRTWLIVTTYYSQPETPFGGSVCELIETPPIPRPDSKPPTTNGRYHQKPNIAQPIFYNAGVDVPSWLYKTFAIFGVGFVVQHTVKIMALLYNKACQVYDEPLWRVVRTPKFKVDHFHADKAYYGKEEIPYPVEQLAKTLSRSIWSVTSSIHRLEKRGKVKEIDGGWQRKES